MHQRRPQLPCSWPWVFSASLGLVSVNCFLFYPGQCCSLIVTCLLCPCSSDVVPDVKNHPSVWTQGPKCAGVTSWLVFSFSPHPSTSWALDEFHTMHSPPVLSTSQARFIVGFSNHIRPNVFSSLPSLCVPALCWSWWFFDLLNWLLRWHVPILSSNSYCPMKDPSSLIMALLGPGPWLRPPSISAGHALASAASIFTLWFSPWPPPWLQAGALFSPHPGERRTYLRHFWVLAF